MIFDLKLANLKFVIFQKFVKIDGFNEKQKYNITLKCLRTILMWFRFFILILNFL